MAPLSPNHRPGCARLGVMRLNAARLNVYEAWTGGWVNGVPNPGDGQPGTGFRIDGASIQHVLNDQPDTANFRTRGFTPVAGQTVQVYSGDTDLTHELFGGRVIEATVLYEGKPGNVAHDIRCIDPTWLMNRRKVLASYINQSGTAIVLDLIARFCRGVTTKNVAPGLPVIDAITFTNEDLPSCLTAVCQRIGAYWYVDYQGDLHVFLNEDINANPITDANPRTSRNHQLSEDLSQVVTKVIGRGGGGQAAIDLPAGNAQVPVNTAVWYADGGGLVEVGAQLLTYTGVRGRAADTGAQTAGALVGAGNSPAAVVPWRACNGALGIGTYQYGATFVTAKGESLIGPLASIVASNAGYTAPVTPTRSELTSSDSGMVPGGTYKFLWSFVYVGGGRANSPVLTQVVNGKTWYVYFGTPGGTGSLWSWFWPELAPSQGPLEQIEIYRTVNGGNAFYLDTQWTRAVFPNFAGWVWVTSQITDAALVSKAPLLPPFGTFNAVWITDIPVGSPTVTQRKIYRTAVNTAQPKLLTTIANNTATTLFDDKADGTLGANAPATDTSELTDNRQIQPGATEIPVSSTAAFDADGGASGGWVRVGSIPVRYTGIGAGALTGVPATGVGALTAPVRYGTQIMVQPRLTGVTGFTTDIKQGDTITIRLEQQDAAAVAAMAERLKPAGGVAVTEDGIIEAVISDSRFTLAELLDQMGAFLLDRKDPRQTLTLESRDPSLQVGRLITITMTTPPISGTFRVQRITFKEIAISGGRGTALPLRLIEASNKLYTFADFLRQLRGREGGVP